MSQDGTLIADKDNYSFRQKVVAKFTPKLYEINIWSKNENHADKPASFVKLSSSILAKFLKEVQEI